MEEIMGNNSDSNNKIRCSIQIVSFSINDMTGHIYFTQVIIKMMKLMKNLLELKQLKTTRVMVTAILISNA